MLRILPSKARRHRACLLDQALGRASAWLDIEGILHVSKRFMVESYASTDVAHFWISNAGYSDTVPFSDAIKEMFGFAKYLKESLTEKRTIKGDVVPITPQMSLHPRALVVGLPVLVGMTNKALIVPPRIDIATGAFGLCAI
ncbi:hypothetical protein HAX54_028534 [Datura stramonium]|uniref:Uncharacterized protein n=1 Tax=Datura stramonium TaxID=4076 RepID=A0ABS8V4J4_DATST|nr:hypothetical protein [Datura stramonium]